ncbi:MAG: TauD/TfdA family dioxygenase [Pseudomonadota bacterium]
MQIRPTPATLGATVVDVALADIDDNDWSTIQAAFLDYGLLIFPNQNLNEREQLKFAKRFGEIEVLAEGYTTIPISNKDERGEFYATNSDRMQQLRGNEGWHTDSSYMPLSAKASILSAKIIPATGSSTEWADMRAAYAALDPTIKQKIASLNAYHSYFYSQAKLGHKVEVGYGYGFFEGESPLHPMVKIHPVTNKPALYIGRHAGQIVGMELAESEALIDELMSFACQPPRIYTHQWGEGDIVVWDNRCLLHRAGVYDYSQERLMHHTRIKGDPASEAALNA